MTDQTTTDRLRAQLIEAMSAVSEDRTCCGWASDWARTLHAEGGVWETLGRAIGWPTGNYDQWEWLSWDEAAALYGHVTSAPPLPVSEARTRLLQALDASYCQALGHTPEGLLAAYEASRTQTVDPAALRDRIAALFRHKPDEERLGDATPGEIADAVLAVLPATPGRAEYDALVDEADRLRRDGAALHARAEGIDRQLAALQRQVAAPVDRAAVLRDFVRELGDRLLGCCQECNACAAIARDLAAEMAENDAELRRVAAETAATETRPTPETHNWGCGCPSDEHPSALGTLPAWLHQRFDPRGPDWDQLDEDDRSYWVHQARAVRRAVARGGFKQPTSGARRAETATPPCVECGHPQTDHREGEDPVTPGQCRTCPDDDARHDYRAAAGARQDGAQS
ncbi:hypothetical protein [Streptomyces ardesiacus]|uniref:hypothetical protein n=1 Tax=Streptomyces ardesiacus TaxID=285564 RepID=UPI0033F8F2C3